jgi:hypothetical protein
LNDQWTCRNGLGTFAVCFEALCHVLKALWANEELELAKKLPGQTITDQAMVQRILFLVKKVLQHPLLPVATSHPPTIIWHIFFHVICGFTEACLCL